MLLKPKTSLYQARKNTLVLLVRAMVGTAAAAAAAAAAANIPATMCARGQVKVGQSIVDRRSSIVDRRGRWVVWVAGSLCCSAERSQMGLMN